MFTPAVRGVIVNSVTLGDGVTSVDRWSLRFGFVSLATVAAIAVLCQLPGTVSFYLIPIVTLSFAAGSIIVLGVTIFLVAKKRPRTGASISLIVLLPLILWSPMIRAAEFAHLGLTAGFGVGQIGSSSSNGGDFIVYDWSVGLAGANTVLIHDVTDEIALPMSKHTHPLSSEDGVGEECAGRVKRLVSHYYVCSF
jgi:hypothetical protein